VVSVDGVNAVSGETADWSQSRLRARARQGFDIKGWRKSLQRVAAFFFTEHQNSYAARTGRPDNVGVIGVAVFRRKYEPEGRILRNRSSAERRDGPAEPVGGARAEDAPRAGGKRWPAARRPRKSRNPRRLAPAMGGAKPLT
jgi:hypothetical protein